MSISSLSDLKFRVAFATWWLIWSALQLMVLLDFGLKPYPAFIDSVVSNTLLAATCLVISNNMRYYLPRQEKYWYVLLVSLGLSAAWLVMVRVALWTFLGADADYMALLLRSTSLRYGVAFLMVACMAMMSLLWYTQQEQKEADNRKMEAERIVKDAELFKLRQQLQPHFLFNSLNSISALTISQPESARHMIQQLSDFLRSSIRADQQLWSTLSEELAYLQLYLDIEKVRFGYRLKTEVVIPDDTLNLKLPSMLLQPIVENAIKFGLYDTVGEVTITVNAKAEVGILQVSIRNPFDEDSLAPAGTGFGLTAIQRRLYLTFARNDLLQTRHEENHFTTTINIPQIV